MKFDELIKLVREVGNAGISDFEYREGELFIKISAAPADQKADHKREETRSDFSGRTAYEMSTNIPLRTMDNQDDPEGKKSAEKKESKREVFEAPVEGVFWFSRLDGTPCPLQPGDHISWGQVLGRLDSRGHCFELTSTLTGRVVNIYIEDGEEIVAREPLIMVAQPEESR